MVRLPRLALLFGLIVTFSAVFLFYSFSSLSGHTVRKRYKNEIAGVSRLASGSTIGDRIHEKSVKTEYYALEPLESMPFPGVNVEQRHKPFALSLKSSPSAEVEDVQEKDVSDEEDPDGKAEDESIDDGGSDQDEAPLAASLKDKKGSDVEESNSLPSFVPKKAPRTVRARKGGNKKGPKIADLLVEWRKTDKLGTPDPPLLPEPRQWKSGTHLLAVASDFKFVFPQTSPPETEVLDHALDRYKASIFRRKGEGTRGKHCSLTALHVAIESVPFTLDLETDESYSLVIPGSAEEQEACGGGGLRGELRAVSQVGAVRGLESFSQLVSLDLDRGEHVIRAAPWRLEDAPRFQHREVLLDTSRHFFPVATIKRAIRAMAMAKFNVFHWHLTDDQAFPLVSRAFPRLSRLGAFSPQERYSHEDVRDVVAWGRLHAVRVVPELDIPDHTESWCHGYPDLCPSPSCPSPLSPIHPTAATPTASNLTFTVIEGLLLELNAMFTDHMLHVGFDEVDVACWVKTPRVQEWMAANGMDGEQTLGLFLRLATRMARKLGKQPVVWEEAYKYSKEHLDKDVIVQVWLREPSFVQELADEGYKVLISSLSHWYLSDKRIAWETAWGKDPCAGLTKEQCRLVLGGGASYWGERVDASILETRMWPRLAGVAEALWTGRKERGEGRPEQYSEMTADDQRKEDAARIRFRPRLHWFRCLLLSRGIGAEPSHIKPAPSQLEGELGPREPGACFVQ